MKEHPIIFSTPMVQAILDGRKTMTRRICKHQFWSYSELVNINVNHIYQRVDRNVSCPYGQPDDVLWVREKWENETSEGKYVIFYASRDVELNPAYRILTKWKPSIHLKRIDARITLKVISVRVERLQDITQEDARKEGVYCSESPIGPCYLDYISGQCNAMTTANLSFFSLWRKINGDESLASNPWVWVIEFERLT